MEALSLVQSPAPGGGVVAGRVAPTGRGLSACAGATLNMVLTLRYWWGYTGPEVDGSTGSCEG